MSVSFHLRDSDHRTRILCSTHVSSTRKEYCTLPITSLIINRDGSSLQLIQRATHRKDMEIWANLNFRSIESKSYQLQLAPIFFANMFRRIGCVPLCFSCAQGSGCQPSSWQYQRRRARRGTPDIRRVRWPMQHGSFSNLF